MYFLQLETESFINWSQKQISWGKHVYYYVLYYRPLYIPSTKRHIFVIAITETNQTNLTFQQG